MNSLPFHIFICNCRWIIHVLGVLRSNDATATKTSLKQWIYVLSVFIKCRRTKLELNSYGANPSSERDIKFRRFLSTNSIKAVHVVVVQKQAKKCKKSMMHVQSCCFAYKTHCFLTFSLLSASLALKVCIVRLAIFTLETDYPSETDNPSSKPVKIDGKRMDKLSCPSKIQTDLFAN